MPKVKLQKIRVTFTFNTMISRTFDYWIKRIEKTLPFADIEVLNIDVVED